MAVRAHGRTAATRPIRDAVRSAASGAAPSLWIRCPGTWRIARGDRRKNCVYSEQRDADADSRCPNCNMRLWVKAIPKAMRFYDLRSTFATHLAERTGDIHMAQKLLGHSSPTITAAIYAGIRDDHAQAAVNQLRFG